LYHEAAGLVREGDDNQPLTQCMHGRQNVGCVCRLLVEAAAQLHSMATHELTSIGAQKTTKTLAQKWRPLTLYRGLCMWMLLLSALLLEDTRGLAAW
jgi:hypothetical protein